MRDAVAIAPHIVRVKDVASINCESLTQSTPKNFRFDYVDLTSVSKGKIDWSKVHRITFGSAPSRARRIAHVGDVLFGTVRPALQSHALVTQAYGAIVASTGFCILRPDDSLLHPSYLAHLVMGDSILRTSIKLSLGSNYPAVSEQDVGNFEIPLFELSQQRQIVEILDNLDEGVRLRQYHCSKLQKIGIGLAQSIFLNTVTVGHRSNSSGAGWRVLPLEELASIAAGVTLGSEPSGDSSIELPYLRVANVQDGHIDTSEVKTVRVLRTQVDSYRLRPGDVLLTEGGDFDKLGRGAVWDGRIPVCLHQNHVFRVRPDDSRLSSDFLAMYTASPVGRQYFLGIAKQTTNLASINSTQLRRMPIPVPPRDEQDRLMRPVHAVREYIEEETAELAKLRLMKQGLVEDFLGGKVRVP